MRRRATKNTRGAALIELMIAAPLLLLMVFGMIEFGSAYNDKIALNQGVRDGARFAARADFDIDPGSCSSGGNTAKIECLTLESIGGSLGSGAVTTVWVNAPGGSGGSDFQVGMPVTVCSETTFTSITPVIGQFLDGTKLQSDATMRIEEMAVDGSNDPIPLASSSGVPAWCGS